MTPEQPEQFAPGMPPMSPQDMEKIVPRDKPDVPQERVELVKEWIEKIELARDEHWKDKFAAMREDAAFAAGKQWPDQAAKDERYRANITLRHINQRVASVYAKNPRVRATRRQKLWSTVWDGSKEQLAAAQASIAATTPQGQMAIAAGAMPPPTMPPEDAMAVVQDAQQVMQQKRLYDRIGKTLEIVAQYSLDEPIPKFKTQAKQLVRRVLTCSAGYVKLGYQRIMEYGADIDAKIKDATDKLKEIEVLSADLADGEIAHDSSEAESLRLLLADLQKKKELVLREGLVFGFPKAWSIIIDPCVVQLKGFVGAGWIAEEFIFTPKQVQKIYGVDVSGSFTPHDEAGAKKKPRGKKQQFCAVFEVYDLTGQVCFTVCSGYPDFLKEPGAPDVELEQFHPYYALSFNDIESDEQIFPPSDVELLRPMAVDYNRGREGLRVHRQANRPATVSANGVFDEKTKEAFSSHADHELIQSNLSKNDDINKLLVPKPTVPIQAELYEVDHVYVDIQRVQGDQAANVGGTAGVTATESSIAENSRVTTLQSNIDDLDDFLTDVMRGAGQVLLLNMSKQQVLKIAGPGAVWPELSAKDVAEELMLEIKAGSSGRPNRQARLAAVEKTAPFLLQVPGVKSKKLVEFMFQEIDENIDPEDFYEDGLPSIVAQNSMAKPNLAPGPGNEAQGPQGAMNADQPVQTPAKAQNMYPAPDARAGQPALTG